MNFGKRDRPKPASETPAPVLARASTTPSTFEKLMPVIFMAALVSIVGLGVLSLVSLPGRHGEVVPAVAAANPSAEKAAESTTVTTHTSVETVYDRDLRGRVIRKTEYVREGEKLTTTTTEYSYRP